MNAPLSPNQTTNDVLCILHLEDNLRDRALVSSYLQSAGFQCHIIPAGNREEFTKALAERRYHLILSDYTLPAYDGISALRLANEKQPDTPFIFLSGTIGEERAVESMKLGATDYVLKDRIERLGPVVQRALREAKERVEKRQTEINLREAEARFRQLAENIEEVFWLTDVAKHHLLYVSPRYEQIWRRSCHDLYQHPHQWIEAIHPEDRPRIVEALPRQARGEYNEEYRIVWPDGSWRWISDRAFPIRDVSGKVYRIAGVAQDITERKQAEEELRANEARFRLLFAQNPNPMWVYDVNTLAFLEVNDAAIRHYGYSRDEFLGMTIKDIRPEQDITRLLESVKATETGLRYSGEWRHRLKNGRVVDVEIVSHAAEFSRRNAVLVVVHDITDRKQAMERIAEQAALLDKARDAILVCELDYRITYWNKSAEQLYGWSAQEAFGKTIQELVHQPTADFQNATQLLLRVGEWTGEIQHITRLGNKLIIDARWTLVRDSLGNPKSILAIHTNVTDKKNIEGQLLRNQRLESIGTLASGIAHDLNNILAPIMMSVDLLKMDEKDPARLELLSALEINARRGADMVRQVLSFGRGIEGKRVEVQIKHLLRDIKKVADQTFPKNIQVRTSATAHLWTVRGDPTQLHQVLLNLALNARDALPEGGALELIAENVVLDEQYAAMHTEAKPGPHVRIEVHDTGIGMPPEILDKIFEPFFTTKEPGKGTGMGLYSSLSIVKSHGGFFRVQSEPGKGTWFALFLPAQTQSSSSAERTLSTDLPHGNGEWILVVDDESAVRQITRQTLEAFGYNVLVASDGAEAVALYAARANEIQLALIDMVMPVMDGASTIQVLKRINQHLQVVAASGLGHEPKAVAAGARYFLAKPYTAEMLLRTIHDALKRVGG
ncbi:MAG: PAS domain S-box protein [Verrucomicrobiota bacterium]